MTPRTERGVLPLAALIDAGAAYNPRRISSAAKSGLKASLSRFGLVQDIVINRRTGRVVGGHQRLDALRELGETDVPVTWVDLDEADEKALNVALNNPHIAGEFTPQLEDLLVEISEGIGLEAFGALALDDLLPQLPVASSEPAQIGGLEYRLSILVASEIDAQALVEEFGARGYSCKVVIS